MTRRKIYGEKYLELSNLDRAIKELQDLKAQSVAEAWIKHAIVIYSEYYSCSAEQKIWWYRYESYQEKQDRIQLEKTLKYEKRKEAKERKKKREEYEKQEYERLKRKYEK